MLKLSRLNRLKLQIYETELENQPEFGGFKDVIQSFQLFRGKRDNNADENAKVVGNFKV